MIRCVLDARDMRGELEAARPPAFRTPLRQAPATAQPAPNDRNRSPEWSIRAELMAAHCASGPGVRDYPVSPAGSSVAWSRRCPTAAQPLRLVMAASVAERCERALAARVGGRERLEGPGLNRLDR